MDYTSIINLALVTVLYSTFISPNITKLSKVKEDILDIEFPVTVSNDGDAEKIQKNRVVLGKKIAQYSSKYHEIKSFLKYFYFIVAVLIAYQLYRLFFVQGLALENIILAVCSVTVTLVVVISVNKYISKPFILRSFGWLTRGGIAPIYLKHMYNAYFMAGAFTRNEVKRSDRGIPFSIRSDVGFCGYNYVLTIESPDSRFLYYVAAGKTGKNHNPTTLVFDNGKQGAEIVIASPKLSQGKYVARLLFNGGFFQGPQAVYETIIELDVDEHGMIEAVQKKIRTGQGSENPNYSFVLDLKRRVESTTVVHGESSENGSIEMLLSCDSLAVAMRKLKRSFVIQSQSGQIDADLIEKNFLGKIVQGLKLHDFSPDARIVSLRFIYRP